MCGRFHGRFLLFFVGIDSDPTDINHQTVNVMYMTVTNRVYVSTAYEEGTGKRRQTDRRFTNFGALEVLSVDVFTALSNITYENLKKKG